MKFDKYINEQDDNTILKIIVRDPEDSLFRLIDHIMRTANPGHSFDVIVDPNSEDEKSFGMDGDGSFYIKSIKKK